MLMSNESVQVSTGSSSLSSSKELARPLLHSQQDEGTRRKCYHTCTSLIVTGMDWKLFLAGMVIFLVANVCVLAIVPDPSLHPLPHRPNDFTFCFAFLYYPFKQFNTPIFNVRTD